MLCAYLARGGMLRLNVYTASFSHSSPFHLPHLLPGSPREKPCHSGNTLAKDAVRDTAALRATFVSFLIEGWQKQRKVRAWDRLTRQTDKLLTKVKHRGWVSCVICEITHIHTQKLIWTHSCTNVQQRTWIRTHRNFHTPTQACRKILFISWRLPSKHLPTTCTHIHTNFAAVAMQRRANASCFSTLLLQSHPSTALIIL